MKKLIKIEDPYHTLFQRMEGQILNQIKATLWYEVAMFQDNVCFELIRRKMHLEMCSD